MAAEPDEGLIDGRGPVKLRSHILPSLPIIEGHDWHPRTSVTTPKSEMPLLRLYQHLSSWYSWGTRWIRQWIPTPAESPLSQELHGSFDNNRHNLPWKLSPASIESIVVLGIHGWYPIKLIQMLVGEPTGTSIKFSSNMAKAIEDLYDEFGEEGHVPQGYCPKVISIPLHGEGTIFNRRDILFNTLANDTEYVEALQKACAIIVATHSQGCPVTSLLLEMLHKRDLVDLRTKRCHVLAMAGIHHGPFGIIKQSAVIRYVETDRARELFSFNDPFSEVSKAYASAIESLVSLGVTYTCISGWLDPVVPLYSSSMIGFNHPAIHRAIYFDGSDYNADSFIVLLVLFLIRLRNIGYGDNGLMVYLSDYLAASLYSGTGHSQLYDEKDVYSYALKHLFIASACRFDEIMKKRPFVYAPVDGNSKRNSYYLPWLLHDLLSQPYIQNAFSDEILKLQQAFVAWKPTHKSLRDLRHRLEPFQDYLQKSKFNFDKSHI